MPDRPPGDRCSGEPGGSRAHRERWRRRHARKERILHTRISDQLASDIRRVAEDLRVPVSNLVRNVLEEAFSVVEQVSDDVGDLLEDVIDQAERANLRFRRHRRARSDRERRARGDEDEAALDADDEPEDAADEAGLDEASAAEPAAPGTSPSPAPPAAGPAGRVGLDQAFPQVHAWQPIVLNRAARCAFTGVALAAGERAYLGIGGGPECVLAADVVEGDAPGA